MPTAAAIFSASAGRNATAPTVTASIGPRARAQRRARPPERVDDDGTEDHRADKRREPDRVEVAGRHAAVDDRADRGSSERVRPEVARRLAHELAHTGGAALEHRGAQQAGREVEDD